MKLTDLRDDKFGQQEEDQVKIEDIDELIAGPGFLNLSEKERGKRADNRIANTDDVNKRLIIQKFNEKPEWKIEPLCNALN